MLGAGQNKPPWFGLFVDFSLQVAKQFRNLLDFINDGAFVMLGQKSARVAADEIAGVQRFQLNVLLVR